jgi:hypothetical protein
MAPLNSNRIQTNHMKILRTQKTMTKISLLIYGVTNENIDPDHRALIDQNGLVTDWSFNNSVGKKEHHDLKQATDVHLLFKHMKRQGQPWITKYAKYPYLRHDDWEMTQLKISTRRDHLTRFVEFFEVDQDDKIVSSIRLNKTYDSPLENREFKIDSNITLSFNKSYTLYEYQNFDRAKARYIWYHLLRNGFKIK